ncbi:hypothetical protein V5053_03900 [Enterobacter hormaechei]|uniref:hypothetical protein n=1 Tax=Enterobacter hormaechei TaxID=158836 RepID=UPI00307663DA
MSTITKERVAEFIKNPLNNGLTRGEQMELARIALASLEAEPVAWLLSGGGAKNHVSFDSGNAYADPLREVTPLYAAPQLPQPAVPETVPESLKDKLLTICDLVEDNDEYCQDIWNACRAAMLQGADGKPELTVWYGAMPETNGKTNWTAMLHREGQHPWEGITIDRSEYPDRVRYEADRMRHLIGELADEPDILAYDAEAHSGYVYPGNSPVIQDGWVMVPAEPTAEMLQSGISAHYERSQIQIHDRPAPGPMECAYMAMLSAAPQQEVK